MCFKETDYFKIVIKDKDNVFLYLKIGKDEKELCKVEYYCDHKLSSVNEEISKLKPTNKELNEAYECFLKNKSSKSERVNIIAKLLKGLVKKFTEIHNSHKQLIMS